MRKYFPTNILRQNKQNVRKVFFVRRNGEMKKKNQGEEEGE